RFPDEERFGEQARHAICLTYIENGTTTGGQVTTIRQIVTWLQHHAGSATPFENSIQHAFRSLPSRGPVVGVQESGCRRWDRFLELPFVPTAGPLLARA